MAPLGLFELPAFAVGFGSIGGEHVGGIVKRQRGVGVSGGLQVDKATVVAGVGVSLRAGVHHCSGLLGYGGFVGVESVKRDVLRRNEYCTVHASKHYTLWDRVVDVKNEGA